MYFVRINVNKRLVTFLNDLFFDLVYDQLKSVLDHVFCVHHNYSNCCRND